MKDIAEVALMFLLLGAVVCHHLPLLMQQLGFEAHVIGAVLEDLRIHVHAHILYQEFTQTTHTTY